MPGRWTWPRLAAWSKGCWVERRNSPCATVICGMGASKGANHEISDHSCCSVKPVGFFRRGRSQSPPQTSWPFWPPRVHAFTQPSAFLQRRQRFLLGQLTVWRPDPVRVFAFDSHQIGAIFSGLVAESSCPDKFVGNYLVLTVVLGVEGSPWAWWHQLGNAQSRRRKPCLRNLV